MRWVALILLTLVACAPAEVPEPEIVPQPEVVKPRFTEFYQYADGMEYRYNAVLDDVQAEIHTQVRSVEGDWELTTQIPGEEEFTVMLLDAELVCRSFTLFKDGGDESIPCPSEGLNSEVFSEQVVVRTGAMIVTVPYGEQGATSYDVGGLTFWIGDAPIPLKIEGERFQLELFAVSMPD